jgi:hypothetical protein
MPAEIPSRVVAEIAFIGRGGGQVKTLKGFKKSHHSVPDAANATTNAFLGKIAESELAEEAEQLFQAVRTGLSYKRKDVALSVTSPQAVLTAKDFTIEILYMLEESEPSRYLATTTLQALRNVELAHTGEFDAIFSGKFSEISFALKKGVRVEAVIDAVEGLEAPPEGVAALQVHYPSDCSQCVISVEGVEAQVRCTGAALEVVFSRGGSPRELMEAFARVRDAFQINKVLAGLIK